MSHYKRIGPRPQEHPKSFANGLTAAKKKKRTTPKERKKKGQQHKKGVKTGRRNRKEKWLFKEAGRGEGIERITDKLDQLQPPQTLF